MHVILGLLGVIVTILVLLKRLQAGGIDIGWLNPFSWHRRRKFRKEYYLAPSYSLSSPMEVAALLMLAVAKADGDITKGQKDKILDLFQTDFKLSEPDAKSLFGASAHVLGNGEDVKASPQNVLKKSADQFSTEQVASTKLLLELVARIEGEPTVEQTKLLKGIFAALPSHRKNQW